MTRLNVIAEGQTEQRFVQQVLSGHLAGQGVFASARCVLTSRDKRSSKSFRGGMTTYQRAKKDIEAWMKEDKDSRCFFTTMFDLYALPTDFPGFGHALAIDDPYKRVGVLEKALVQDLGSRRFIPYIQMHEFEALIFCDPWQLGQEYLEHKTAIRNLAKMAEDQNPELIDGNPETAPSKRLLKEIPEYDKVMAGVEVTKRIGLQMLRSRCRHFDEWISRLESLDSASVK